MNLAKFPRRRYTIGPTPLEFLPRFTEAVGGPQIQMSSASLSFLPPPGDRDRKSVV